MTTTASETLEFHGYDLASCEDHLNFLADDGTLVSVILQVTDPYTHQVLTEITHVCFPDGDDAPYESAPTFTDFGECTVVSYTSPDGFAESAIIPHAMDVTAVVTEYVDEEAHDDAAQKNTVRDDTAQESDNTTAAPTFDDVTAFLTGYIGAHTEHVRDYAYDLRDITADVGTSVLRSVAGTMRDTLHTIADVINDRVSNDTQPSSDAEGDANDDAAGVDWSAYDAFEDDCTQLHDHVVTTVHITVDGTDTEDVFPITVTIAGEKHAITADDLDEYGYADIEVITARIAD